jgi:ankyrin repeat protein
VDFRNDISKFNSPFSMWPDAPSTPDAELWQDATSSTTSSEVTSAHLLPLTMPNIRTVVRPRLFASPYDMNALEPARSPCSPNSGTSQGAGFYYLTAETRYTPSHQPDALSLLSPWLDAPGGPSTLTEKTTPPASEIPANAQDASGQRAAQEAGGSQDQPGVASSQSPPLHDVLHGKRSRGTNADDTARDSKRLRTMSDGAGLSAEVLAGGASPAAEPAAQHNALTPRKAAPAVSPERQRQSPERPARSSGNFASPGKLLSEFEINRRMLDAADAEEIGLLTFLIDAYRPNLDAALLLAARNGKAKSVRILLERGASVNATDDAGGTPLMWAVSKGYCDVAATILAHAPSEINLPSSGGTTILHRAIYGARAKMVLELLKRGANPNARERRGYTALHVAMLVHSAATNAIACHLVKFKVDTNAMSERGETFLLLVASSRIAVIPPALEAAARKVIDVPDAVGRTPLMWACMVGNDTIALRLLELGADRALAGPGGKTAHDFAVESGQADLVAMLG